jgi:tRNA 2-(methylsulfanyl)-N6-isopentenyladenosine37 hydroxylase
MPQLEQPTWSLPLVQSDPMWLKVAMADLPSVMRDHVNCERKAATSALSLMRSYPERADVVEWTARLAHEETRHIIQVSHMLTRHGESPGHDRGDDYAAALQKHVRKTEPGRLLDRLLVFALIEGRSAERLALLASAIEEPRDRSLYQTLAEAEFRHRDGFLRLASAVEPVAWKSRAVELCAHESALLQKLPVKARIH